MADVLHHPFFDADPEYHVTPAWKLHYPGRPRLRYVDSQQDDLATAVVGWANELHAAIHQDDVDVGVATVQRLLTSGCVHYGLCLQGHDLSNAQKSITPLHRAARCGRLEIVQILLGEVHLQALAAAMDTMTAYNHTALHWA